MGGHRRQGRRGDPGTQGFPSKSDSALLERALDHLGWQRHLGIHQIQLDEFLAHGFRPAFGQRGEADQQRTRVAGGLAVAAGAAGSGHGRAWTDAQLTRRARRGVQHGRVEWHRGRGWRRRRGREGNPAARADAATAMWRRGVTWRGAGAGADSGLVGPTEKIRPWLRWSKGLEISAGTSTCFCTRRRVIKAGLSRARISANGSGHQHAVTIIFLREEVGRGLPQFAERESSPRRARVAPGSFRVEWKWSGRRHPGF